MGLQFLKTDHYMDKITSQFVIQEVTKYVFERPRLFDDLAQVILLNDNFKRFYLWSISYRLLHQNDPERIGLSDKLSEVYNLSKTEDLSKIRGGILEYLVGLFVQSRYSHVGCNCQIVVDEETVGLPNDLFPTIDRIGVDDLDNPSQGEAYECKVSKHFIKKHDVDFIVVLRDVLIKKGWTGLIVGLVTFETRNSFIRSVSKWNPNVEKFVIARENFMNMYQYEKVRKLIG